MTLAIFEKKMERELALRIILENPPAGVEFGLQKGGGSNYETVQKQRFGAQDLRFDFPVRVKGDETNDSRPHFLGPFVQGPPGGRFVYIDIGISAGQTDSIWSRRLKIPLTGISWEIVRQLAVNPDLILEARVPGTGKDSGPTCGTVKPFTGWQIRKNKP